MKHIKVKFFGVLSEVTGKQEEDIVFEGNLDELLNLLKQKYPDIAGISFSAAINQEINGAKNELSDGDEVALLPPFTGG
jgi:molybdopterin converting factor small subunit